MSADLERQLAEMGDGYRPVVDRLRSARTVSPRGGGVSLPRVQPRGTVLRRLGYLVAASLFIAIGLAAVIVGRRPVGASGGSIYTVAYAPSDSDFATMVASQRADGSWENDFITRQNAAALRHASGGETRIAYRKAVRFLRSRGLAPLSDEELSARGAFAAERIHGSVEPEC